MTEFNFSKYLTPKTIINLSIIVGFFVFIVPLLVSLGGEVEDRAESLRQERGRIASRSESISRLADLRKTADEAKSAYVVLQNILPQREELFSFSDYLESISKSNGVNTQFSFTGEETSSGPDAPGQSAFRVVNNGSFQNILSFIKDIENSNKFLVKLSGVDLTGSGKEYRATISSLVFFYD
ncbi:MAG: hypothetical protein COT89_01200 [Candidatus Colwellbacteria bacterium CG10_big_fil_rev_8_21_14_0_10_42_22]|uniref:Type 4 fimbrial biogenesis protein PilO n=1 Tax=Candidatus Colwellbacteria bacterium CG10_big_fil_rev_8_21_14_0_10_42_22 TaxID=1974540 RepID=A0A2H0VG52_9BACT|nr:MAG: hypothetical protein COT89_01200 [Candidatus Colwellbacteria bacterium CG10_big_fil_rev_8_21_14_0_10_42_22]